MTPAQTLPDPTAHPDPTDRDHVVPHGPSLATRSIRELIADLAATEEGLRHLPALVPFGGHLVSNPERRLLLRHQRLVVGALRSRRAALRGPTATA
ncbi:hypothetical protein GCM10023258_19140 [Terrabacter aeriphilus]|uniref:Uncharacterized protein n=1 Tax=Terrabacter aeriphilus TaxID=515662 RepID=A0ABP9JBW1_9MICO